jgi:hypothetical protein
MLRFVVGSSSRAGGAYLAGHLQLIGDAASLSSFLQIVEASSGGAAGGGHGWSFSSRVFLPSATAAATFFSREATGYVLTRLGFPKQQALELLHHQAPSSVFPCSDGWYALFSPSQFSYLICM